MEGAAGLSIDTELQAFEKSCLQALPCKSLKEDVNAIISEKTPVTQKVHDMLICELCQGFVYEPLKCEACEQFYCSEEITEWMS